MVESSYGVGKFEGHKEGHKEGRKEGREEGKALTVIELLKDGDISFEKAQQKIDKLKSKSPDSDFWVSIYKSLQNLNPNATEVNEPAANYKAPRKKRTPRT
jgi:flagellar biosynthesis/type III secretory pathway protein FliH